MDLQNHVSQVAGPNLSTTAPPHTQAPLPSTEKLDLEEAGSAEIQGRVDSQTRSRAQITQGRIQFATFCLTLFLGGWNDGTTGPMLPRIQEVYDVRFLVKTFCDARSEY